MRRKHGTPSGAFITTFPCTRLRNRLWKDTRSFIAKTLDYLHSHPSLRPHLEVETYTWSVLPDHMKIPLASQIAREMNYIAALQHS